MNLASPCEAIIYRIRIINSIRKGYYQAIKAYKFKLKVTKKLAQQFEATLDSCRELYNAALQERRDAWKISKVSVNFHSQALQLPEIKLLRQDLRGLHSQVLQDTLKRLDKTFDAFFRRIRAQESAGFPRFKGKRFFNSFTYPQSGFRLEGNKLRLSKIGSCRLRLSREIEGKIKTCTIKRQVDGWFCIFTVEESCSRFIPKTGATCGIDVGLENFATLSTDEMIENPKYYGKAERALKIQSRLVSKKKRGGANRRKAVVLLGKKHLKIQNQRKDFFHKTSLDLIGRFDEIAVEDLHIKGMLKNHQLAKSISDASWGSFVRVLENKAANAGRRVWKVPAAFTSQDCSRCGERVKKSLCIREHRCIGCGFVVHRDVNAALNIVGRADQFVRVNALTQ